MDTVSLEHRAAMTAGRKESEAIKAYINHLHKGGIRLTQRNIEGQLATAERNLAAANESGTLLQQIKADAHLVTLRRGFVEAPKVNVAEMEQAFVDHAAGYSEKHGITRVTWRKFGVPVDVLKRVPL